MLPEGDHPKLGASARTLGVRVPRDIEPDQNGDVQPGSRGMSVAPSLRDLPVEWVPKRLKHLREGASFLSYPLVLFEYDDAERAVPVPTPQLPGNGAPYNPCAHDADVIRVHLVGSFGAWHRSNER